LNDSKSKIPTQPTVNKDQNHAVGASIVQMTDTFKTHWPCRQVG